MMAEVTLPVAEHLYDETAHVTRITEYRVRYQEFISGRVGLPLEGARFDIAFEGSIRGERLRGSIAGVDFAEVRAEGRFQPNMHAEITTDDGEEIAYFADGIFIPSEDEHGIAQARCSARLTTASPRYSWLNKLEIWVSGSVDLNKGEISMQAYVA